MGKSIECARIPIHACDREHRESLYQAAARVVVTDIAQTQGGDFNNNNSRFWLALPPSDAFQLIHTYLQTDVGEINVQASPTQGMIRVNKPAGNQSVQGAFVLRANDSHAAEGQTLVVMKRAKVGSAGASRLTGTGLDTPLAGVLVDDRTESAGGTVRGQRRHLVGDNTWIGEISFVLGHIAYLHIPTSSIAPPMRRRPSPRG